MSSISGIGRLPTALTPLIGREREIDDVCALLRNSHDPGSARLITLTGSGGVGKTRLALSVAQALRGAFGDGIAFVSLAPIADPQLVLPTLALALDVRESSEQSLADRLAGALTDRRLLLILDNFEQVTAAAPVLPALLTRCPTIKALVTSRAALRVSGEQEFAVLPLPLPDVGSVVSVADLKQNAAVSLFVQRSRAIQPHFELTPQNAPIVSEICRQLDGLPLAIELAAARAKTLSPLALLNRLSSRLDVLAGGPRDAPARLQTMRDAVAWSYELLDPAHQRLFRRLSVFAGDFSLDAAEAICGESTDDVPDDRRRSSVDSVLDDIAILVDNSLVTGTDTDGPDARFRILETVREYGSERLATSGEVEEVRRRHAAYFLRLVEPPDFAYLGGEVERTWTARLHRERDNIRIAFDWFERSGNVASLVQMAGALWDYGLQMGLIAETRDRLQRALAAADGWSQTVDPSLRARVLLGLGLICIAELDIDHGLALLAESRRIWDDLGDEENGLGALILLALGWRDKGEPERTIPLFEESLRRAERLADPRWRPFVLMPFGLAVARAGDLDRAEALLDEAIVAYRALGDASNFTTSLRYLGEVALARGDVRRAVAALLDSIRIKDRDPEPWHLASALEGLATIAYQSKAAPLAARLFGAAEVIREPCGIQIRPPLRSAYEETVAALQSSLGETGFNAAWTAGRALNVDTVIAEAENLSTLVAPTASESAKRVTSHGLTNRELEILRLLATGLSSHEIAAALYISERTASTHLGNIYGKLGVRGRNAAIAYALRHGLA